MSNPSHWYGPDERELLAVQQILHDLGLGTSPLMDPGSLAAAATVPTQHVTNPNVQPGAYTLQASDAGLVVEVEINSVTPTKVTVPPDVFVPGDMINLCQIGTGVVFLLAGAGVTLHTAQPTLKTRAQYSQLSLRCRAVNEFVVSGDAAQS